ncbi:MAG: NBR1-Ig-like domain-containing protein [Anaerolineaceae bacterium]|nr:NBR1-Ig-like domain-containing protein [Anaerolineaceae bacterium]
MIEGIEVLQTSSIPPEVKAIVTGRLANSCQRLGQASTSWEGNRFVVSLPVEETATQNCSTPGEDFDKVIPIDISGLPDGEYLVEVNGEEQGFTLEYQTDGTPAAVLTATPTQTPQAQPETTVTAEPTPAATQQGTTTTASTPGECQDRAIFLDDVSVPDNTIFEQGAAFVKTWRVRNSGTCAWSSDYQLVFAAGDDMGGKAVRLAAVDPGGTLDVSVNMSAPGQGGTYLGNWQFQNASGSRFGVGDTGQGMMWVKIVVRGAVVGSPSTLSGSVCNAETNQDYIDQITNLINQARTGEGLRTLKVNTRLAAAAMVHSNDMACNNFVEHYGSDGSTWYDRIQAQGYTDTSSSENIYAGNPAFGGTPDGAFTWWMNSQIHRDAILNEKFTEFGVGYVYNASSQYAGYYTVVFARP